MLGPQAEREVVALLDEVLGLVDIVGLEALCTLEQLIAYCHQVGALSLLDVCELDCAEVLGAALRAGREEELAVVLPLLAWLIQESAERKERCIQLGILDHVAARFLRGASVAYEVTLLRTFLHRRDDVGRTLLDVGVLESIADRLSACSVAELGLLGDLTVLREATTRLQELGATEARVDLTRQTDDLETVRCATVCITNCADCGLGRVGCGRLGSHGSGIA